MPEARIAYAALICGVSPLALLLATNSAAAQSAQSDTPSTEAPAAEPETQENEIVVTGFRASLGSALNAKRAETSAIDVIKAEDIADFPDNNLAESLQRIPGVSINRVGGEGRAITVRGLLGQFHPRAHQRDGGAGHFRRDHL